MLELALETAVGDLSAGTWIERRCMKSVADTVEHRRRQLVTLGRKESASRGGQLPDCRSLAIGGFPKSLRLAPATEQIRVRALKLISCLE